MAGKSLLARINKLEALVTEKFELKKGRYVQWYLYIKSLIILE